MGDALHAYSRAADWASVSRLVVDRVATPDVRRPDRRRRVDRAGAVADRRERSVPVAGASTRANRQRAFRRRACVTTTAPAPAQPSRRSFGRASTNERCSLRSPASTTNTPTIDGRLARSRPDGSANFAAPRRHPPTSSMLLSSSGRPSIGRLGPRRPPCRAGPRAGRAAGRPSPRLRRPSCARCCAIREPTAGSAAMADLGLVIDRGIDRREPRCATGRGRARRQGRLDPRAMRPRLGRPRRPCLAGAHVAGRRRATRPARCARTARVMPTRGAPRWPRSSSRSDGRSAATTRRERSTSARPPSPTSTRLQCEVLHRSSCGGCSRRTTRLGRPRRGDPRCGCTASTRSN